MTHTLFAYIAEHGYTTIFILVFLAELGVPNPVPNELMLLYVGTLTATGTLDLIPAVLTAVAADFIGTSVLYHAFYLFGSFLIERDFKWFPKKKLNALSDKIARRGKWGIFVGRLIPYARGYASVGAGLLRIPPRVFLSVVIFSAMLWSGGYVLIGHFVGPQVEVVAQKLGIGEVGVVIVIVVVILVFFLASRLISKKEVIDGAIDQNTPSR